MAALEEGLDFLKFFPAEQAGGAAFLKSLASPFAGLRFCPTGGVTTRNAADYLSLPNVICVGGSWVAPDDAVEGRRLGADREAGARSGRSRLEADFVLGSCGGAGSPAPHRSGSVRAEARDRHEGDGLAGEARLASATCGALLEAGRIDFARRRTHQVMRE